MCRWMGAVKGVGLLNCALLFFGEGVKETGSVLASGECWGWLTPMMSGRSVWCGDGKEDVCFHPMVCRLCGNCVCMLVGIGKGIGSDCGEMSGQKSLKGRSVCALCSISR
jgi:hypothetical protein